MPSTSQHLLLLFSVLCLSQALIGQDLFDEEILLYDSANQASLSIKDFKSADMNNDGHIDIVTLLSSGDMHINYNDGLGNFDADPQIIMGDSSKQLEVVDIDNDGDFDIVVSSFDKLSIWENLGNTVFEELYNWSEFDWIERFYLEDADLDGTLDIVMNAQLNNEWRIYIIEDALGSNWPSEAIVDLTMESKGLYPVHLNDDNHIDYLVYFGHRIVKYESNPTGVYNSKFFDLSGGDHIRDLSMMQGPTDELPSLVINTESNGIQIYPFDKDFAVPSTTIGPLEIFILGNHEQLDNSDELYLMYMLHDLDGDEDLDILALSAGESSLGWYKNRGENPYSTFVSVSTNELADASEMQMADLNGDGTDDLVAAFQLSGRIMWYPCFSKEPIADFVFHEECYGLSFHNTSENVHFSNTTWEWDFEGDGIIEGGNPSYQEHPLDTPGLVEVTLTVCNDYGCDSENEFVFFERVASLEIPVIGQEHQDVQFENNSFGFTNITWSFGDDAFSTEDNPVHVYTDEGTFLVEFYLTDNTQSDCTYYGSREIFIEPGSNIKLANELTGIYPNPAGEQFEVKTPWVESEVNFSIMDASMKRIAYFPKQSQPFVFDVDGLIDGIYFIQAVNDEGRQFFDKLIIK